jgi:flagellar biosynthesis protein FlhG
LEGKIDLLLIDTSAGVGRSVMQFILAAGELLLITNPEPTALTDAYALLKVLAGYQWPVLTKLVVNNARNGAEGELTGRKLATVVEQFLGQRVETIGTLPYDKSVAEAVKRQLPLLQSYPHAPAAVAIDRLGERLWVGQTEVDPTTGVSQFFRRLLSLRTLAAALTPETPGSLV